MNDENIQIGKMLKDIFQHWKYYVPIGLTCLIAAIVFIMVTPKEYEVTSSIQLLDKEEGMTSELKMLKSAGLSALLGGSKMGVNVDDEMIIMKSRKILAAVIQKNNMQVETKIKDGLKKKKLYNDEVPVVFGFPEQFLDTVSYPIKMKLTINANKQIDLQMKSKLLKKTIRVNNQQLPLELNTPLGVFKIEERIGAFVAKTTTISTKIIPLQSVYEDILEELDISEAEAMSDIVVLNMDEQHKTLGKNFLNGIMNEYISYSRFVKLQKTQINTRFVQEKLDSISLELAELEYKVERYKKENEFPDIATYTGLVASGSNEIEKNILSTQIQLRMIDYVLEYLAHPENKYSAVPMMGGSGEKAIEIYNKFILERLRLLQSSEPNNPLLQIIDEQLVEQRKILIEAIQAYRNGIKITLVELEKKNILFTDLIAKLPTQEREYIEIKRQQGIKELIFLFLMQKLQERELENSPDELAGRVVDEAYVSFKAVYPKKIIVLAVAFIVACILSLVAINIKIYISGNKRQ